MLKITYVDVLQVNVIEFPTTDISAYTYERTILMEERSKFLQELNMSDKDKEKEVRMSPQWKVCPVHPCLRLENEFKTDGDW